MNDLAARMREIALALTAWPSITGSAGEAEFARKLEGYLHTIGFGQVWREPIEDDAFQRSNVFALKSGRSRRTIVLSGHFDVVPVDDYGDLAEHAFSPDRLRDLVIARLRQTNESPLALSDLESGEFLPGRGLLDMKSGLAAGVAAMEEYQGAGSLLLVATPDEEDRSAGMRAAAARIPAIAREHELDIALVVNLDAISDQGNGSLGRSIALGSIGKQLLTALVIGREAHACYPFDGINAAYLAAELVAEFECAPELAEITDGEIAAPPTVLHAKDLKSGYNVTTPARAWIYWNTLQHRRSAAGVLAVAQTLACRAMARALSRLSERAGRIHLAAPRVDISVLTYAELSNTAPRDAIISHAQELTRRADLDLPARCQILTEIAWALSGRSGPAVVLGFGSIPYPAVSLHDQEIERRIQMALDRFTTETPDKLSTIRYFPGISDMSFLGQGAGGLDTGTENTPIWGTSFALPPSPGYPVINIGPWGRDYHHWLERLYMPYAFEVLPRLLLKVMAAILDDD